MPRYEITSPDGRRFEVTAPEGATQNQVLAYAQANFGAPASKGTPGQMAVEDNALYEDATNPLQGIQQVAPTQAGQQIKAPVIPNPVQQVAPQEPKEEQPWYSGIAKFGQDQQKKREQLTKAAVPFAQDVGAAIAATPLAFEAGAQALSKGSDPKALTGNDWKHDFIAEQRALVKKNAENPELKDEYLLGVDRAKIRNLPQNVAFSVLSMGSSLAGAAVGLVIPVPLATEAGAAAAGAAAAYRMDTNGFLRDIREKSDDLSIKATGKPLTDEQWLKVAKDYESLVREHGAWEALPEAIGNVIGIKLTGAIFKEAGQGLMGVLKSFGAGALELVNELGTETITQIGQHNTELAAGVNDDPNAKPRSFTNPDDIWKSAKEVAPDVLLLTGAMSGGAHVAGSIYNSTDYAKTRELAKELNAKDFLDTKTPEGLLALQNAAQKQFQSPRTKGDEISPFQTVATPGINPNQPPEPPEEEQAPGAPPATPTPRAGALPVDKDTQAMLDELQGKPAKENVDAEELQNKIEENGIPIKDKTDADKLFSNGHPIYAFHELDEQPTLVTSQDMLDSYTPDQLVALPIEQAKPTKENTPIADINEKNLKGRFDGIFSGKDFASGNEDEAWYSPKTNKLTTEGVDGTPVQHYAGDKTATGLTNVTPINTPEEAKAALDAGKSFATVQEGTDPFKPVETKPVKTKPSGKKPVQNKDNPIQTFDAGNNTEVRVFPNDKGYIANFYDKDSGKYIGGKIFPTNNFGDQALPKALEFAQTEADKSKKMTGETPETQQVAPQTPQVQQVAPTEVQANPTSTVQPSADVPLDEKAKAKQDLEDALGDLSLLMGKGGRLNIVPEDEQKLMPILTKLMDAAFRMGYIKFKEAAKFVMDMIRSKIGKDVADQVSLDHLQGAYIGMAGKYQDKGADNKKDVISVESLNEIHNEAPATANIDINTPQGQFHVATQIGAFFLEGGKFENINQARAKIEEITGQKIPPGTNEAKSADEAIEVGVVLAARQIVGQGGKPEQIYDQLVNLYGRQPNLSVRSSESVLHQAYSTPAPLAYIASQLAGINSNTKVYEPTAGNGMLLIGAKQENIYANELQPGRAAILEMVLPNASVTDFNAAKSIPGGAVDARTMDVVIANPPFGVIKDKEGKPVTHDAHWYNTKEIDHAIAFRALRTIKDNGRAVLIVGGVMGKTDDARREDYRGKAKRDFYSELYRRYNVVDHFTASGNLYTKQGASYPVDIIVIDGVRNGAPLVNDKGEMQTARALPAFDLPKVYTTYGQLKEKLDENTLVSRGNERPSGVDSGVLAEGNVNEQGVAGGVSGQGVEPGTTGGETTGGGEQGVSENGPTTGGQPESTRGGAGNVQPKPGNAPKPSAGGEAVPSKGEVKPTSGKGTEGNKPGGVGGVSLVSGERVGSGLVDRAGQETETATQVSYPPHSGAKSVGTLVPNAMAQAIDKALSNLEKKYGNIDRFVAENLDIDVDTLQENFSAEQVDAIALAIMNAEMGKGFIIGDQTGIGKGRVVAAMIKYALLQDKIPIFVTEKPNLYSDMIRDLDDIGMTDSIGLDKLHSKILITNGDQNIPYTLLREVNNEIIENNLNLKAPKKGAEYDAILKSLREKDDLGNYKVIFTTYNQLQTQKGKETERQKFIRHFGAGNYLIFDESHNAGGAGETQARTKEQRENAKEGKSLVQGRAAFVRELVQNAFGTFFSSATYAKRPDVMDLYASTDMSLAVDKLADLAQAIKNGGIPMQQTVARMLTEVGQYIRRERTFAGVSYDTKEAKVDKQTAENMASSMRKVLDFSRAKELVVKDLQKSFDRQGGKVSTEGEKTQVQSANFGSTMHVLIDQMLLALKAKSTVDHAIERLEAGEKVVITVANTMGSFLQTYADEMNLNVGDLVDLSFKNLYLNYLEKQRFVTIKTGNKKTKYRLTDADLGPELTRQFEDIKKFIEGAGFSEAPISPIDYIHNALRKAEYKTEEITGRTIILNYSGNKPTLAKRVANIKQRVNAVKAFNNGEADVIILNQAGSTGISLHASSKVDDKRKRHMILAQAEKNIDTHMQMLGRVHRTGQVITPAYSQMMADIPAEMRPAAVLLKKMASLNANTTGSRKSAVSTEGAVDFMNDYGGQVSQEYLRDNPDIHEAIGGKKIVELQDDPTEGTEADIRRLTGYVPILPIKQQEEVYKDIIERYNELLQREESMGTNKLESKAHDLDARTLSSKPITEDKNEQGSNSPFAQPANMEKVDVKRTIKPYSKAEVQEQIDENLEGKNPKEKAKEMLASLTPRASEFGKQRLAELAESGADPTRIAETSLQHESQIGKIKSILDTYPIGTPIVLKSKNGTLISGVVTNVENKGKTKNPLAGSDWKMQVALANGDAKSISINFSQVNSVYELREESEVPWNNPETDKFEYIPMMDLFDKSATVRREKRWMVTGNLLAGFAAVNNMGQIMSYTKDDGTTGQGILMPRTFDFEKEEKRAPVKLNTLQKVQVFFDEFQNGIVQTEDGSLKISKRGERYQFITSKSKREGGQYYLDLGLTNFTGTFHSSGQQMNAVIYDQEKGRDAIKYILHDMQLGLVAGNYKDEARALFAPKEEFKPPLSNLSPINNFIGDREQNIKELQAAKLKKAALFKKFAEGKAGLVEQESANLINAWVRALQETISATKPEKKSAKDFFVKATKDWGEGKISDSVYSTIKTLYEKYPFVLEGLSLSVKKGKEDKSAAGEFDALQRVINLFKGTTGVTDATTIRHELTHSLEQMMDKDASKSLVKEWGIQVKAKMKSDQTKEGKAFFKALTDFYANPSLEQYNALIAALPDQSYYQYVNPSEYWAVNAEKLLNQKLGGGWDRFKLAIRKLYEGLKSLVGATNQYALHKVFDDIMTAKGTRMSDGALRDYVDASTMALQNKNFRNFKGAPAPKATWDVSEPFKQGDWEHRLVDKHLDTKQIVKDINEQVGQIQDDWDPYLKLTLMPGRKADQVLKFLEEEGNPFIKKMNDLGVTVDEFEKYLHNRHAEEYNDLIASRNAALPDGGSGIYTKDAHDYLNNLPVDKKKKYQDLAKDIDNIVKETQDLLVASGTEKAETIQGWRNKMPYYVPLNRDQEELDFAGNSVTGFGKGISTGGAFTRAGTGSTKTVVDILNNVFLQRERAINRAENARVGKALIGLALQAPNTDFWLPINPKAIRNKKKLYQNLIDMGLTQQDADNFIKEPTVASIDKLTGQVQYRVNPVLRGSKNVITVRVNGEDWFVFFNPGNERAMRMAEALKNMDSSSVAEILSGVAEVTRTMAAMNTQYNPLFGPWNLARDYAEASITLEATPIAGKNEELRKGVTPAMRAIYRIGRGKVATNPEMKAWMDLFDRYKKAGGLTGFRQQFSGSNKKVAIVDRELKKLNKSNVGKVTSSVMDWLSDYNESLENAVRLTAFKIALDQGISEERAAEIGKEITINFDRKGQWSSNAAALFAFFGSSIQGTAKMARIMLAKKNGKTELTNLGKKIVAGGIFFGVMQAIALKMAGFDEDEPPEYLKNKDIIIPTFNGKYLNYPMPLGYSVFPSIGRIITEYMLSNDKDLKKSTISILSAVTDAFNPLGGGGFIQNFTPTVIDPLFGLIENKDAFGRPIAKPVNEMKPTPGYERNRESASAFSKGLSYALNYISGGGKYGIGLVSPTADQLDYLMGQYAGGVGREVMKTVDLASAPFKNEPIPSYRIPIVGKFYGESKSDAAVQDKFYKNIIKMSEYEGIIKRMETNNADPEMFFIKHPKARFYDDANKYENEVRKLSIERRQLIMNKASKEELKDNQMQKIELMKEFNQQVR